MEGKGYKRKVILINPKFQLKISGYFAVLSLINIGIFYSCVYYFFKLFFNKGVEIGLPKNHVFFMFIEDQMFTMNMVFIITALIAVSFLMFSGVFISHKVAGPLYRLTKHLDSIAEEEKEFSKVDFRKGDFFPEIAESFNKVVDKTVNKN